MRNRLLVFLAFLPFLGIGAQGTKEPKWYEAVTVSGFVDVNYTHIDNNKEGKQEDTSSALHTYNKQFSVAAVELDVEKTADEKSPWGFRIDMMNGQNAAYQEGAFTGKNQMYNLNMLQQAYVSFYFPILKGVTVDVGKMATHIGTEVLESADNYNYTGGYIFFNTVPFIHTGARANLALTDDWSMGLYLYNSAAGTGYQDPATYLASNGEHAYVNSETARKAYGTQVKGSLVKDKVGIIWNTLYGSDVQAGRVSNQTQMANDYVGNTFIPNPRSKFGRDYWFVNHVLVSITPMDKLSIMLDWTFGEKSGSVAGNAKSGIAAPVGTSSVTILRDENDIKNVYNTYGVWVKYDFTDKFSLAMRYEHLDDSRYGGVLGNAPLGGYTPASRIDLLYAANNSLVTGGNLGQLRTFTITPTYVWSENIIVKLDLRRDWGLGEQFVNRRGQPSHYQNSVTLGMVAKF